LKALQLMTGKVDWNAGINADRRGQAGPASSIPGVVFTGGWDGMHTIGVPVVVVSHQIPTDWIEAHPDAPFHFVTDGVEAGVAKAQEIAGERTVAVTAGTIARQCLELGLLDEVAVDLVPVVMGQGRPFFGELATDDAPLGDPTRCVQGDRVTHLVFPVAGSSTQSSEGQG